jgi:deferrochelatase/peroxidase EfeB
MVGRWRSGAPVDLTPLVDNPTLGADPHNNNNFDFRHFGELIASDETYCPFSAHIRKVRPRFDLSDQNVKNQAIRAGLPFGPEVTDDEDSSGMTSELRGLAFGKLPYYIVSYFKSDFAMWL